MADMFMTRRHANLRRYVLLVLLRRRTRTRAIRIAPERFIMMNVASFFETRSVSFRNPLLTRNGLDSRIRVHDINALKRKVPGLEQKEIYDPRCDEVAGEEDEAEGVSDAVVGVGCEETNQEVACFKLDLRSQLEAMILTEPVEGCCQRGLLRSRSERETFPNDHPYKWAPSASK